MSAPLYALVAYVHNPVGRFVEQLRRDLHPEHPGLPAHVTILPPRPLHDTPEQAQGLIQEVCRTVESFEVDLGDVETFAPSSPTVFIRVAHAAYRLRELHDMLNLGALEFEEPWPYMPHLTIVKLSEPDAACRAAELSRRRWARYRGSRRILIDELTFVREGNGEYSWIDLAPIPLGNRLAPAAT
jgi:2'-5' RNA ligase